MYFSCDFPTSLNFSIGYICLWVALTNFVLPRDLFIFNFFRIRRLGYPIRHVYAEFVDRYYLLVRGMKAKMPDAKEATNVIANLVLPNEDWQLGKTKVFLKVTHHIIYFYPHNCH